jgi:sulfite exporter TauE/SafE
MGDPPFLLCFGDPDLADHVARMGLPVALLFMGLAGSLIHCIGMCGPFVLGQVAARADQTGTKGYGELQRLKEGALIGYHLGRITTYAALGLIAGATGSLLLRQPFLRQTAGVFVLFAALALFAQVIPRIGLLLPAPKIALSLFDWLAKTAAPSGSGWWQSVRFGLLLGFLPCGFLWSALAVAGSSGHAVKAAIGMVGFGIGTMPALIGLGWGGVLVGRNFRRQLRQIALPLQALNAMFLFWCGARLVSGL